MTLADLIKKGGLAEAMTVTAATTATPEVEQVETVAEVATVTVATPQESPPEMTSTEEASILEWFAYIEETDSAIIAEYMNNCRNDLEARRYFLKRATKVP